MTCGGHFPPLRLADFPVASTASSTTSRGTQDASTPREIQSLKRVPATSTVCVITRDHAHNQPERPGATRRADQDQLMLSGIEAAPVAGGFTAGLIYRRAVRFMPGPVLLRPRLVLFLPENPCPQGRERAAELPRRRVRDAG